MKWDRGHQSANVEDRRAKRGGKKVAAAGAGIGGLILMAVMVLMQGGDAGDVVSKLAQSQMANGAAAAPATPDEPFKTTAAEEELVSFVSFVLDDIQATWTTIFQQEGKKYQPAKLVLFRDTVQSACGAGQAATGPFYCPADQKAYIDLSFYALLKKRFGAPGDFAQAYVLAHEIGHHIQTLLGTSGQVHRMKQKNPKVANELSVLLELQADCYAGVWAHATREQNRLERGDIKEGLRAAKAIGDDTLQKQAGARVTPENWTHGSSKQRMKWFQIGLDSGSMASCDTFGEGVH